MDSISVTVTFAIPNAEQTLLCPVVVGRDAALAVARGSLQRAREGRGGALLVSGEAGVGKSRILTELVAEASGSGVVVLRGACFEADRAVPYAPLLDLVRAFALHRSPALVAHCFAPAAPELLTFWPELAPALGNAIPRPSIDPEEDRRRLLHAVSVMVDALSRTQPVLLAFEDVHWSDDPSLDLIRHLSRSITSQRVLLTITFRTDEVEPSLARLLADLDRSRIASDVALARLSAEQVAEMVRAIFGTRVGPGDELARTLHALTDGNPFFVEEVLKGLVTSGDLARTSDGAWHVDSLERVRVPRTATEAVRRRLGGLTALARELADVAAVAGRRFDFALLQALTSHDERELLALVKELIAAQLVVDESSDRFAFRHALTREAIYADLLARERVALHRSIAAAIERIYADSGDTHLQALAYHAFEAGDWPRARNWATRAAEQAMALHAPREALAHLDRAFEAAARMSEEPSPALLLARGQAAETLGNFDGANADFSLALERARRDALPAVAWEALHALGLLWSARDYARAGVFRHDALALARTIGDPALVARSLNRVGNWQLNLEEAAEGIRHHEEALALFEGLGHERGVTETVDLVAMSHLIAGHLSTAALYHERSVARFERLGDRRGLANSLAVLAVCGPSYHTSSSIGWMSDRTPETLASERPIRLAREIDWRAGEAFCLEIIGECLAWRGAYDRALPMARDTLAISAELQHLQWQANADYLLGWLLLDLSSPASARAHLERGFAIATRLGSHTFMRWIAAPLAIARLRAGDAPGASTLLDELSCLSGGVSVASGPDDDGATLGERQLWASAAEVALASGNPARALEIVDARLAVERRAIDRAYQTIPGAREHVVSGLPQLLLLRARALIALDRLEDADAALADGRRDAQAHGARPLSWRIEAEQARVYRRRRQRAEARSAIDAGRAITQELVRLIADDGLRRGFEQAVDEALPAASTPGPREAIKATFAGLTRREREVAQLVAAGKSNRAVARALGVGERTVETHVAAALAKLGFSSRSQLAAWAVDRGLARVPPPTRANDSGR